MANPAKQNQAPAPAGGTQTTTSTPAPFSMGREAKIALARAIATRDRKWGAEQAKVFLGAVLAKHGIAADKLDSIIADLDFNGAVINTSQFAQWADGSEKEPDRLGLGFKLRASETRKASILAAIEGL